MISTTEVRATSSGYQKKAGAASKLESKDAAKPDPVTNLATKAFRAARILVVEDHAFVREEIVALINRQPDLISCGEADSISSTTSAIAAQKPDVLLLDLRLKDGEVFGLIGSLKFQ